MKPIIDWCAENRLLTTYAMLTIIGAVLARCKHPKLQAAGRVFAIFGLAVGDAIHLATRRNQDVVPTVPELPKSGDE
jgi:hypothetical protein